MTTAGISIHEKAGVRVAVLQVGAADPATAIEMATAFLAKRHIEAEYLYWDGGQRLKVGVMGLRKYHVTFRLTDD